MNRTKRRTYVLSAIVSLIFLASLYGFYLTLKTNLEPPFEEFAGVGPGTYFDPNADPVQANIGVYVISVGNLELTTGTYFMDFYLTIRCDRPCQPDPDILNAVSVPEIERQNADTQGDTLHFYRIRANLLTDVYLQNYPFDEQELTLSVGDKQATKEQMEYIADPDLGGWDDGHMYVLGWFVRPGWDATVVEDAYPVNINGNYHRYRFSVTVYKPWLSSFFNSIFPVLVIMLVGLLSFLMRAESATERLALTSSTLVALILFHLNLNASIPPLNYLTYADKFMLINYLTAALSIGISAILLVLKDNDNLQAANKLNAWTRWLVPPLWALLLLAVTIQQFSGTQAMG
jgi:hypothetical protein